MTANKLEFFRFGMARSPDQLTVRLRAIIALSEVISTFEHEAHIHIWLTHSNQPMSIGYGSASAAESDRRQLVAALLRDQGTARTAHDPIP